MVAAGWFFEGSPVSRDQVLISSAGSRSLDREASDQWGLDTCALVEAAGRTCARVFMQVYGKKPRSCTVLAGTGHNAADALVMLRALILRGCIQPSACSVFLTRFPDDNSSPFSRALLSVQKLGVTASAWDTKNTFPATSGIYDDGIIIDGIAGTGLDGPLRGTALAMTKAVNTIGHGRAFIVSIDIPSGLFDGWQTGMPVLSAHATLAIEPQKLCLYAPSARPHAGRILSVGGIFPGALTDQYREASLINWKNTACRIPAIPATAHKYERGLVEIRAGSPGYAGAGRLAAMGAQAAGAGLVRLIVDPSLYPVIAPACCGIMVTPDDAGSGVRDHHRTAVLLGPGWGRGEDRQRLMEQYLPDEEQGLPLILDADAIALAGNGGIVFHGNAVLTPHTGEFAAFTGIPKETLLANPIPVLRRYASEWNATILFKSHVLYIASADGRIGIIDGMNPLLAAGGSGDVLAGFCAGIASLMYVRNKGFDGFTCACAAASLLVEAGKSKKVAGSFVDPAQVADAAAAIAGKAWLPEVHNE